MLGVLCMSWDMVRNKRWNGKMFWAHNSWALSHAWACNIMCNVLTKCLRLYMQCEEGVLFTLTVDCPGIESCRQAKNNYLNKIKTIFRNHFLLWSHRFPYADDFDRKFYTVQFRLKIDNNPNFDSISIHCSAAMRGRRRTRWRTISPSSSKVNRFGVLLVFIKLLLRILPSLLCWMDCFISLSGTFNMVFVKSTISVLHFTKIRSLS